MFLNSKASAFFKTQNTSFVCCADLVVGTMSKLKVLEFNQMMMAVSGIYPRPSNPSLYLKLLHAICPYYTIFGMSFAVTLAATYIYQGSTRLSNLFEAFAIVIGGIAALFSYLNMRWKMNVIGHVPSQLQEIADRGNCCGLESISNVLNSIYKSTCASLFSYRTQCRSIYVSKC